MAGTIQIIVRLVLASILGGLVGFEREKHNQKIAGFRTHILVCVSSALIMLTSLYVYETHKEALRVDPSRLASSVLAGIGFLGAGTIIRSSSSVTGLTTAASLWTVSGIGLAVGCGFYSAGITTTVIALVVLYFLRKVPLEKQGGGKNG